MNFVKILHCADIHIGAAAAFLGTSADLRRAETLITFERIIDLAKKHNVDLIAIAGDLFDTPSPEQTFVDGVLKKIAEIPQIKVVYAAGNHDPLTAQSPFMTNSLPENLYVLPAKDSFFTFDELNLRVWGRSFESSSLQGEEYFSIPVPKDDYINILVQHGELSSDLNSDYNAITPKFVKNCKMDYIALGHVHKATPIGKIDSTSFAYCGCPEGQGFDELDQKGVYIGKISKGKCDLEFIPTSKRLHIHEKIDITDKTDIFTEIIMVLKAKYGDTFCDNLYKIELIGSIEPDFTINTAELKARLDKTLYFAKIKDSTEYKINLEDLSKETSLKGIFVREMLKEMENSTDLELCNKALKIGLKAFNSEVKFNED